MIGLFDSGVGGLSIALAVQRALPGQPLLYFADSGYAPYGERDAAFVQARSRFIAHLLLKRGCTSIVVACNTASALAVDGLRAEFAVPFIAVEPAIKPALAVSKSGVIAVMATANTLASERFAQLCARLISDNTRKVPPRIIALPCPGVAQAIEDGLLGTATLDQLLGDLLAPLAGSGVDTVTLGCTHYAFAAQQIAAQLQHFLGQQVQLLDNAAAVAQQVVRLQPRPAQPLNAYPHLQVLTTGDVTTVGHLARQLLGKQVDTAAA